MLPRRFQVSLNPLWPHYLSWACVGIAVFAGLIRYGILGAKVATGLLMATSESFVQTGQIPCTVMRCLPKGGGWIESSGIGSQKVRNYALTLPWAPIDSQ